MGQALGIAVREQIVVKYKSGQSYREISQDLSLAYNTVRGICKLWKDPLRTSLLADYSGCGRKAHPRTKLWHRRSIWLKKLHPSWGAPFICYQLREKYPGEQIPHERTLQKWFKAAGLTRPRQRQAKPKISSATAVDKIWQVDAKERFSLAHGAPCCYLTIVDEYSGACIDAHLFPLSSNQSSS